MLFGTFGFSYIGLVFLICLFVPNILFVKFPPKDSIKVKENRVLLILERLGQVSFTCLALISGDLNVHELNLWTIWLAAALLLIILYLVCWVRYFRGEHVSMDFLRPFLGIPLPLAVLPVAAALLLAVYGKLMILGVAASILAVGHIGITAQHLEALQRTEKHI